MSSPLSRGKASTFYPRKSGKKYSAAGVAEMLGVSDNTARNDLRTLVRENLLTEISENDQKTVYRVSQDLS
ncbi:DeoR family transcriptional regulator [Citrobacter braakii]|uniref:DeoR family transcriptional regulator n=1 Tax=Citrobacter braakii TaxID=57706 RepID=UPI000907A522|nr:DeoR family transcriptional regulator [Citrobacter braakii]